MPDYVLLDDMIDDMLDDLSFIKLSSEIFLKDEDNWFIFFSLYDIIFN